MAAIPGTERHRTHWHTTCSCGAVISTCGCSGGQRGDGPRRVIPNGCAKCQFKNKARPITEEEARRG